MIYNQCFYLFRVCIIKSVDGSNISSFCVHECEGSNRIGARSRKFLFTGHANGGIQLWDLSTAMDQSNKGDDGKFCSKLLLRYISQLHTGDLYVILLLFNFSEEWFDGAESSWNHATIGHLWFEQFLYDDPQYEPCTLHDSHHYVGDAWNISWKICFR